MEEYKFAMSERLDMIGKYVIDMAICFPTEYIISTDYSIEGAVLVGFEAHGLKKRFKIGAHIEKEWENYKKEINEYIISKYCELEEQYFRLKLSRLDENETIEGI